MTTTAQQPRVSRALLDAFVDLKRVRAAGAPSVPAVAFTRAWGALVAGEDPEKVMRRELASALVATRMGAIDAAVLASSGLTLDESAEVLGAALAQSGFGTLELRLALSEPPRSGGSPAFCAVLADQARAGITSVDDGRLPLMPAESHADHCLTVAVLAALLSDDDAAATDAFLCGLAHHLHNATLPDAGWAGEVALGRHLTTVVARLRARELATLAPELRARIEAALTHADHLDTPAGRAFNTADVLDRVGEMRWHERTGGISVQEALDAYEVVHDGPMAEFGRDVLTRWSLWR